MSEPDDIDFVDNYCTNQFLSKQRQKNMIVHKIAIHLRQRYYDVMCSKNATNVENYNVILGCTERELAKHLEKSFKKGMTFHNHGIWEVDHKFPVSLCDVTDPEHVRECFSYKNLQALWKYENRLKSNKVEHEEIQYMF